MANDIDLYIFVAMENAVCDSVTSEAAGYPVEQCIDNNPDTFWKPTGTGDQTLDFDLQTAHSILDTVLFIKNYTTLTDSPQVSVSMSHSDNGADWTGCTDPSSEAIGGMTAGPLRLITVTCSGSPLHRYWRIVIENQNEAIELAGLWFGAAITLGQGNQWPERDKDIFMNRHVNAGSGRSVPSAIARHSVKYMPRQYMFSSAGPYVKLRDAHQLCQGSLRPLVIQEGASYATALLVKFTEDDFDKYEYQHQLYRPRVAFQELPWIRDGETY